MAKSIRNITIVGGGTAGWMSALLLTSLCKTGPKSRDKLKITLIESPNIPTVGVGEATVPGMPRTLKSAGISEQEFLRTCNATFKLGVLFDRWNVDRSGNPIGYVNPFARGGVIDGVDVATYFQKFGAAGLDFTQVISPSVDLGNACKGPRAFGSKEFAPGVGYAYHLDAGIFAKMLARICVERGVVHILDDMERVETDERGYIAAVHLKERGRQPIELVIDCTGFRGLIINEALDEPFISYSDYLANDKALAVQIPHRDPDRLEPMTRSTALGAGWTWRVPLYNRIGTGYVFSSAHRTDDEARAEFLEWLGPDGEKAEPRIIPMRVGRTRNAWVKNCVAIGLSGGFIEPLESTAIHMIDTGIRWLVTYMPDSDFAPPLRDRYNKLVGKLYDEVLDFICLHYALSNRTDSQYWIDARKELKVPDPLAENLELWKHRLPAHYDLDFTSLFSAGTYQAVLMGKQVYDTGWGAENPSGAILLDPEKWQRYLTATRAKIDQTVQATADHRSLLRELRGEVQPTTPSIPWALTGGGFAPSAVAATVSMPGQKAPKATDVFTKGASGEIDETNPDAPDGSVSLL